MWHMCHWTHIAIMIECWKGKWYIFNMLKSNFCSNFNIWLQICSIFNNFCTLGLILRNHVTVSLLIEGFSMAPRAWGGCCDLGDHNVTKQNKQTTDHNIKINILTKYWVLWPFHFIIGFHGIPQTSQHVQLPHIWNCPQNMQVNSLAHSMLLKKNWYGLFEQVNSYKHHFYWSIRWYFGNELEIKIMNKSNFGTCGVPKIPCWPPW